MESQFIELISKHTLGYIVVVILGGLAAVFGIYKLITEMKSLYDKKIMEKKEKERSSEQFRMDVKTSLEKLQNVSNEVSLLNTNISTLQTDFNNFRADTINSLDGIRKTQKIYNDELNTLLESDKESIKAYIITEYQKWQRLHYIDIYAMQSLETRYEKYLKENGNTFVATLMHRLRSLPGKYVIKEDDMEDFLGEDENCNF